MDSKLKILLEKSFYDFENCCSDFEIQSLPSISNVEHLLISFNVEYLNNSKIFMNLLVFDNAVANSVIPKFIIAKKYNKYDALEIVNNCNIAFKGALCFTLGKNNEVNIINEFFSGNRSPLELCEQITKYILLFSSDYKDTVCDIYKKYS